MFRIGESLVRVGIFRLDATRPITTRYRSIPKKIDHERILPLYESDSNEEFEFLKEKFVKRQYYAREEHQKLLYRVRKGFAKQISKRILMPIRAANAFRRQASSTTPASPTTPTSPTAPSAPPAQTSA